MNKLINRFNLPLILIAFISMVIINQSLFSGFRLDLTESQLYSVSDGTQKILGELDEPINLYFFFSETASESQPAIRSYAVRVKELLQEYQALAGGKLNLSIIDPEPFSEDEDRAAEFGLQAIGQNVQGDAIYFGLVGTNSVDDKELLPYFHPDKEALLEYDISKLIYRLNQFTQPTIGIIDGLSMNGGFDAMTRQPKPRWTIMQQIDQLFNIETVDASDGTISEGVDTLIVVQPKALTDKVLYAIDQFVLNGGKAIIFSDPHADIDRLPPSQQNPFPQSLPGQDLNRLFSKWGVELSMQKVVLDNQNAMQLNAGNGPVKHLGVVSLGAGAMLSDEIITNGFEAINVFTGGYIKTLDPTNTDILVTPLLTSSTDSMLVDAEKLAFLPDPSSLQKDFAADDKSYPMMVRISGRFKSAFEQPPTEVDPASHLVESTALGQIIIAADVDMLADRMWVQVQQVFGQAFTQAFADNGDLFYNLVDIMSGSGNLIGLRGRGRYSRPFDVVNELRAQAEVQFLAKEQELQQQLEQTEQQLTQLQTSVDEQGVLVLSPEQEQAINEFQQQKVRIRKELRDVRHQLDKDIDQLGSQLAFWNTAAMPILLIIISLFVVFSRRKMQS